MRIDVGDSAKPLVPRGLELSSLDAEEEKLSGLTFADVPKLSANTPETLRKRGEGFLTLGWEMLL